MPAVIPGREIRASRHTVGVADYWSVARRAFAAGTRLRGLYRPVANRDGSQRVEGAYRPGFTAVANQVAGYIKPGMTLDGLYEPVTPAAAKKRFRPNGHSKSHHQP